MPDQPEPPTAPTPGQGGLGPPAAGDGLAQRSPAEARDLAAQLVRGRANPLTNTIVAWALRIGLVVALVVLVVGLVVELTTGPHRAVAVKMFDLFAPRPVGERIMAVGVLLLTLTPACGVVSVLVGWLHERDWQYLGVGLVVVVVLGAAVAVGVG